MRRGLASLIIGVSLTAASVAWAGLLLLNTVLDPDHVEDLASELVVHPEVRAAMTTRLAGALDEHLPPEVPMPNRSVAAAANQTLDDPEVAAMIEAAILQAQVNALSGTDETIMLDGELLARASRQALIDTEPRLIGLIDAYHRLDVELPATGLGWIARFAAGIERVTTVAGLLALAGAFLAAFITTDRPAMLRRIAVWAFAMSAFWLAVAIGLPRVLELLAPTSIAVTAAAVGIFLGAMKGPALALTGLGVAMLAAAGIDPHLKRRQAAGVIRLGPPGPPGAIAPTNPVHPFDRRAMQDRIVVGAD